MGIYVFRPKSLLAQSLSITTRKFSPENRKDYLREVSHLRKADPVQQKIKSRLESIRNATLLTNSTLSTPVTGTTIVKMPDDEFTSALADLQNDAIGFDGSESIGLIQPERTTATKNNLTKSDLWHLEAIGLQSARRKGYQGSGSGVTIAVLDTGIEEKHPELVGRVAGAYNFDSTTWVTKKLPASQDTDGHGTHVAGLICGENIGVAPGANVLSGIMLPQGRGRIVDFIIALEWAASTPAIQIVNMSAGIPGWVNSMKEVISDLLAVGVLPIIATGNEGRNHSRSPGNYSEVISVGSMNQQNKISAFSCGALINSENHYYHVPDLVAPGEGVYSSVKEGNYEAWDGTSMATPIVSGVAALILEAFPSITLLELQEELLTSCKDLGFRPERQGSGLIQVDKAILKSH